MWVDWPSDVIQHVAHDERLSCLENDQLERNSITLQGAAAFADLRV